MAVREGTRITATVTAKKVQLPEQYRKQGFSVPVYIWAEDGLSAFQYSSEEDGTFLLVPAGWPLNFDSIVPDADGTLLWVKVAADTVDLAIQTSENRMRNR